MAVSVSWSPLWPRRSAAFGLAWALLCGAACGARDPAALPAAAASPWEVKASDAKVTPNPALLGDRSLGRSGLACADCHAVSAGWGRPAPRLGGALSRRSLWSGATSDVAVAANLCVERYLDRPALTPPTLDALVAAVVALPEPAAGVAPEAPTEAARLYDAACRHCHEAGPAGPVLSVRWTHRRLVDAIRGLDRAAHPATHMPAFDAATLPDAALAGLVEFIADAPGESR